MYFSFLAHYRQKRKIKSVFYVLAFMPGSYHIRRVLKLKIVVQLRLHNFQLIRVITKDNIFLKLISCQILDKSNFNLFELW